MALDPVILPELREALAAGAPIVALESTLIAHGLPVARRREVADALEQTVRAQGAVPATLAVIDGRARIGLDQAGLTRIVGDGVRKASLRDLAIGLATGGVWATTVATTMALAARVGIRVFATGGIGGVHRGVTDTFDESADLVALASYPVAVVSAGAKSVLDLPRTVERLETLGVPVVGFGTDELPAFHHAHSGIALQHRVNDPQVIADIMQARFDTLEGGGLLIVQPPPADSAQDPARIESLIADAERRAATDRVRGSAITPFLLAALAEASGGDVVDTNIALVLNNARLAAQIAVADSAKHRG